MRLTTRQAVVDDYAAFVRLFPELGAPDPMPTLEQFSTRILPRAIVIEDEARTCGYASWQVYGATAHVVQVVVDPAARGRGAGAALMRALRGRAVGEGCTRWYLNVKQDNASAIRLYERAGFARQFESFVTRIGWAQLATLGGDAGDVTNGAVVASDDPEIAARFAIDGARLSLLRARGLVMCGLSESGAIVGFAAFDPGFPMVYPLRVVRPSLARPLLWSLRRHADEARFDFIRMNIEGDRPLYEHLRAAGAELTFALYQMSSAL